MSLADRQSRVLTARRIAENEAQVRAANERIETAAQRVDDAPERIPFICECARPECLRTLRLSIEEYELGRANPRRFICSPGHESTGHAVEQIVCSTERFVLVEKDGEAGEVAEALDPRADDAPSDDSRRPG